MASTNGPRTLGGDAIAHEEKNECASNEQEPQSIPEPHLLAIASGNAKDEFVSACLKSYWDRIIVLNSQISINIERYMQVTNPLIVNAQARSGQELMVLSK